MREKIIVALDMQSEEEAVNLVLRLKDLTGAFKVGLELYNSCGPSVVQKINDAGGRVFLDLKFHDIPNTVARAAQVAAGLGVFMFNLHASGGKAMMREAAGAARERAASLGKPAPLILGVTVLTSMSEEQLNTELAVAGSLDDHVLRLATLCREAGLDGVVASAREAQRIRRECGEGFLIVTPGVRPAWAAGNDQVRIVTPLEAIENGSDYLVIGRPVTAAADPHRALAKIIDEMEAGR